jgi:hypothetical protein
MDVAPAVAEVAVVTGAVGQGACVQHYAAAAAWVRQQTACVGGAAGGGGWGHDRNGWQAASVRMAVGSGCGLHATACSGAACVRQRAATASKWEQPAAQLQWKTVMAAGGGAAQRAAVDSYFLLTCGIFTQALCTR